MVGVPIDVMQVVLVAVQHHVHGLVQGPAASKDAMLEAYLNNLSLLVLVRAQWSGCLDIVQNDWLFAYTLRVAVLAPLLSAHGRAMCAKASTISRYASSIKGTPAMCHCRC
jgi:hypothetical protein